MQADIKWVRPARLRHIGSIGVDQSRRRRPRAFVLLVGERGIERPRRALARDRGTAGFQRAQRQRTKGGRTQVADMARHLEQSAL